MSNQLIKIYSANSIYSQGLLFILKKMIKNVVESRELIWQLLIRNFKVKYKQSLLGWAWLFLMPIVTMGTFLLLNISGVIRIGEIPVPYPIFGLLGFSLWQVFSNGWSLLTGCVAATGNLVSQINFPKEAIVLANFGQIVVDFLIRLLLVILVYLLYGLLPSAFVIFFPLFVLPLFLLTLGLGFFTALLKVVAQDIQSILDVGLSFFLFLMPVMFTMPAKGFLTKFNQLNPFYFLIDTPREIIISGNISNPKQFLISTLIALVIFVLGWFTFYLGQTKIPERV